MAPKMVTNFRRSLSFPDQPSNKTSKLKKNLHVRSTSLPCRSHPIISQLKDEIAELSSWSAVESDLRTSGWLCNGLTMLKSVHESLDDLLLLPQSRESLRGGEYSDSIENFLEDFLRFVDVYGMFQSLVLRVKEEYSSAQIAVRRKEESKIAAHCKNLKKISKEIGKLVTTIPSIKKLSQTEAEGSSFDDEAELIEVVNDVVKATVLVSVVLFGGLSGSLAFRKTSRCSIGLSFGKKTKSLVVEGGIREFEEINLENLKREGAKMGLSKKMHDVGLYG